MKRIIYLILIIICIMSMSFIDSGIKYFSKEKYDPQIKMKMTPEIKKLTNNISKSFEREIAICMSYSKPNSSTILIDDYKFPHVKFSSKTAIVTERCGDKYPVTWHNHPPRLVNDPALSFWWKLHEDVDLDNREKLIYLSGTDIYYVLSGKEEYSIVSSGTDNWAWWSRKQVSTHADSSFMLPIESQHYVKK